MTNFYNTQSEEDAIKKVIQESLKGHEEKLMTLFIQKGPEELRKMLQVKSDFAWAVVFDYLVFNLDVLKRCVDLFYPFFKVFVLKNGPVALRDIFYIQEERYNPVFEKMFDDLVIARGLLFDHVYAHTREYLSALEKGQGSEIRSQLGLSGSKYEPLWHEVVDFLLDAFTREKLKVKQKDQTKSLLNLLQSLLSK